MGEIKKEIFEIEIKNLIPYINNAKKHDTDQIDRIASSIREFGFLNPVIIDKDFNVIAGHGRIEAAKKLKLEKIPCLYVEGLSDAQRRAYILADNRIAELGSWDMELVNAELERLVEESVNLDLTGFELLENLTADSNGSSSADQDEDLDELEDVEKLDKYYGCPYQGNKSRIADLIINTLPVGNRLVDLFGGGGAITHCAMLSGKWNEFLYNDLNPLITTLFMDAVKGKYHDCKRLVTREEFESLKETDGYVRYIWSFGNNGTSYIWHRDFEKLKLLACEMILEENPNERRLKYMAFCKELKKHDTVSELRTIESLQNLTRLQALERLEALERLTIKNISYEDYIYSDGDVVYCDVPYENLKNNKCDDYGIEFDSLKFYEWVKSRNFQVFFSSYEISDKSFFKKKLKSIHTLMGNNSNKITEYLYSNRSFESAGDLVD